MKKRSIPKSLIKAKIELKESGKSTDQKRMEESLAIEHSFLRQVIDTVPAFICVKTEAGSYALANKSLAKAYGTTVSGVEGKTDLDFSPTPEEAAAFRKDDLDVIHGRRTKTIAEEPITYEDGTVHWYSTTKIPVIDPDGSCSKLLAVAMDITELREHRVHLQELVERRTAELTESQAALIEAQAVAHMGSWEYDAIGDRIKGSEEFYRLFNVAPKELTRISQFIEKLHPDDRERVQSDIADALQQNRPYDTDYRVKLGDDGWRDINARGRIITDNSGKTVSMVGTCLDITERKRADEQVRSFSKELEQKVNELDKAVTDLKRSNQELEQFAYVASHDLQEPLRMVSSYTQLLERRYKDKLDQDAIDFINFAVDGANRMQHLINDLLEFSRVTTKGKPMVKLDLSDVLGQAVANLHNKIQETGSMIVNDDLPFAYGDEGQLIRVFQNLLDNAMKFKGDESPRINITAKTIKDEVQISIADNGIGIDKIYSERVFTIFQRLHTKADYPGTGIGLAICKRTIERHGGKIWFESEPGKGTTFCFTLKIK